MKTGLILEGGAMRGMFTAGILDVFLEQNLSADGVIGVSAGAAFGTSFHSGQRGRTLRYNLKYAADKRYCGLYSWLTTGDLYGAEFCYHTIPEELDPFDNTAFAENPAEFWVTATDAVTGEAVYHRCETMNRTEMEWVRASASLPLVSRPVKIGERILMDGGIADAVPLRFFESIGYEKNLVILTRPADYRKEPLRGMRVIRRILREYPRLADAMESRWYRYNAEVEEIHRRADGERLLVLCPETDLPIQRIEKRPEVLRATYEIGRSTALRNLERIRAFL